MNMTRWTFGAISLRVSNHLPARGDTVARLRPAFDAHQYADNAHPVALLRARRERPRHSRAAEQRG